MWSTLDLAAEDGDDRDPRQRTFYDAPSWKTRHFPQKPSVPRNETSPPRSVDDTLRRFGISQDAELSHSNKIQAPAVKGIAEVREEIGEMVRNLKKDTSSLRELPFPKPNVILGSVGYRSFFMRFQELEITLSKSMTLLDTVRRDYGNRILEGFDLKEYHCAQDEAKAIVNEVYWLHTCKEETVRLGYSGNQRDYVRLTNRDVPAGPRANVRTETPPATSSVQKVPISAADAREIEETYSLDGIVGQTNYEKASVAYAICEPVVRNWSQIQAVFRKIMTAATSAGGVRSDDWETLCWARPPCGVSRWQDVCIVIGDCEERELLYILATTFSVCCPEVFDIIKKSPVFACIHDTTAKSLREVMSSLVPSLALVLAPQSTQGWGLTFDGATGRLIEDSGLRPGPKTPSSLVEVEERHYRRVDRSDLSDPFYQDECYALASVIAPLVHSDFNWLRIKRTLHDTLPGSKRNSIDWDKIEGQRTEHGQTTLLLRAFNDRGILADCLKAALNEHCPVLCYSLEASLVFGPPVEERRDLSDPFYRDECYSLAETIQGSVFSNWRQIKRTVSCTLPESKRCFVDWTNIELSHNPHRQTTLLLRAFNDGGMLAECLRAALCRHCPDIGYDIRRSPIFGTPVEGSSYSERVISENPHIAHNRPQLYRPELDPAIVLANFKRDLEHFKRDSGQPKKEEKKPFLDETDLEAHPDEKVPDGENDRYRCCVCLENRNRCVMRPCNHVCACLGCTVSITKTKVGSTCPICRTALTGTEMLFF